MKSDLTRLQRLIESLPDGFAYHQVVNDSDGNPVDYLFVDINPAFEKITGLVKQDVIGKRVTEVYRDMEEPEFDWMETYGKVAANGQPIRFDKYCKITGRWYSICAYSDECGCFAVSFRDTTEHKQMEADLLQSEESLRTTLHSIGDAVIATDTSGRVTHMNPVAEVLTGWGFAQAKNRPLTEVFHIVNALTRKTVSNPVEGILASGKTVGLANHTILIARSGIEYQIADSAAPIRDYAGSITGVVWVFRDVTAEYTMEEVLREREEKYRSLFTEMMAAFALHRIILDANGVPCDYEFVEVNAAFYTMTGLENVIGRRVTDVYPRIQASAFDWIGQYGKVALEGDPVQFEEYFEEADCWYSIRSYSPKYGFFACIFEDITSRKQKEEELQRSEQLLNDTQRLTQIGGWVWTVDEQTMYWTDEVYRIHGFCPGELEPGTAEHIQRSLECYEPEDREVIQQAFQDCVEEGKPYEFELRFKVPGVRWVRTAAYPVFDNGRVVRVIGNMMNITERKQAEKEIEYLSFHDSLTGLYNRRFFEAELTRLDVPRNLPLSLVMIDVNGLKLMNDAFGHTAGDELLRKVAQTLQRTCRADDIVTRLGGDEFAIFLPHTNNEQAHQLVKRMQQAVSQEKVEDLPISVACGSGTKTSQQESMADVFRTAEANMYRHKTADRSSQRNQSIILIMQTLYAKSPRDQHHSNQVSHLCGAIGSWMGLSQDEVNELTNAGTLHDIGKIAISESILDKVQPLTDAEWREVKRHPEVGYSILSAVNDYGYLANGVLAHHERWDGTGYPNGLQGEDIPQLARIMAVADSYAAMTSDRPYRKGMSHAEAMEEMKAYAGLQFDPEIVRVFCVMMHEKETVTTESENNA